MPVKRRHVEQLNTSESWRSPVSVIAHIDLDAFFAQCLGIRINADPELPLGCRQWNSLIAVNYPSRKFGIKRGMSVEEAKKLCPEILLPNVATFKKGEQDWGFHENPQAATHKVSLDFFRRESRKLFNVFKSHFKIVQKAGVDECYVDLGPEVYKTLLTVRSEIFSDQDSEDLKISHEEILDIGAELVKKVRLEIHSKLKYTCSAGIAQNKMLAKLGSGFKKPFNQTIIYPENIHEFLSHFPLTKIGGWRGKIGKQVEEAIMTPDSCSDQCKYIRDSFTLQKLESALKGDSDLAKDVYYTVRGGEPKEVVSRLSVKSMIAVKNFPGNNIKTWDDVDQWLKVYAADIAGRLADLDPTDGTVLVPKTISVRKMGQSKQQPFELKGLEITDIRDQIHQQSLKMCNGFLTLPCSYMASEISNFYEIPRERLIFKNFKVIHQQDKNNDAVSPENEMSNQSDSLFVDDEEKCHECKRYILASQLQEHKDWHYAKKLQQSEKRLATPTKRKPTASNLNRRSPQKNKKRDTNDQKKILDFFKK